MKTQNIESFGLVFESAELMTEVFETESNISSTTFKYGQPFLIRVTLQLNNDPALFIKQKPPVISMSVYFDSIGPGKELGFTEEMTMMAGNQIYKFELTSPELKAGIYKIISLAEIKEFPAAIYHDGPIIQIYYD